MCVNRDTCDVSQMMMSSNQGSLTLSSGAFDFAKFKKIVISMITIHNLPFKAVEWEGVRTTFHYLRNDVQTISRNTAKSDILKLYSAQKKKINNMLQMCRGRVILTSDMWISLVTNSYLAMTIHFIDKN